MIPVFVGCEILKENKCEDGSRHVVERRCKLNVDAPRLLKRVSVEGSEGSCEEKGGSE